MCAHHRTLSRKNISKLISKVYDGDAMSGLSVVWRDIDRGSKNQRDCPPP